MAKEIQPPTSLIPFIQQHHGAHWLNTSITRRAAGMKPRPCQVSETQYRYPGPSRALKEVAIVMIADCCESACARCPNRTGSRVETLVPS